MICRQWLRERKRALNETELERRSGTPLHMPGRTSISENAAHQTVRTAELQNLRLGLEEQAIHDNE